MARNSVGRYFEGLIVGGAVGFVIGMLTAPKPGSELRRELIDNANDLLGEDGKLSELKDQLNEKLQPYTEKATELKSKASEKAEMLKNRMSDKAQDIRSTVNDKASVLKDQASTLREKAVDKAQNWREQALQMKGKVMDKAQPLIEKAQSTAENGQQLLDNYMGNNSGPMYKAGAQAQQNSGVHSMDSCQTTYEPNLPEAAGG